MLRFALALLLGFLGSNALSPAAACGGVLSELHLGYNEVPRALEISGLTGADEVDIVILNLSDSTGFGRITQVVSVTDILSSQSLVLVQDQSWTSLAWGGSARIPPVTSYVQQVAQPLDFPSDDAGPRSGRAILLYAGRTGLSPTTTNLFDDSASLAQLQSLGLLDAVMVGPEDSSRALTAEDLAALGSDDEHLQEELDFLDPNQGSSFGRPATGDIHWLGGDPDANGIITTPMGLFQFNPAATNTSIITPEPSAGLFWGIVMMLRLHRRRSVPRP